MWEAGKYIKSIIEQRFCHIFTMSSVLWSCRLPSVLLVRNDDICQLRRLTRHPSRDQGWDAGFLRWHRRGEGSTKWERNIRIIFSYPYFYWECNLSIMTFPDCPFWPSMRVAVVSQVMLWWCRVLRKMTFSKIKKMLLFIEIIITFNIEQMIFRVSQKNSLS